MKFIPKGDEYEIVCVDSLRQTSRNLFPYIKLFKNCPLANSINSSSSSAIPNQHTLVPSQHLNQQKHSLLMKYNSGSFENIGVKSSGYALGHSSQYSKVVRNLKYRRYRQSHEAQHDGAGAHPSAKLNMSIDMCKNITATLETRQPINIKHHRNNNKPSTDYYPTKPRYSDANTLETKKDSKTIFQKRCANISIKKQSAESAIISHSYSSQNKNLMSLSVPKECPQTKQKPRKSLVLQPKPKALKTLASIDHSFEMRQTGNSLAPWDIQEQ